MKLYVSIVDFQLHLSKTLSNAKMVYILNVDFDEWNNIDIHDFSIRDRCVAMNSLKIQNSVVQTFPNEKLSIRPNVELDECNKLCIHDFSIWDHLGFGQKVCSSRYIFLYDK